MHYLPVTATDVLDVEQDPDRAAHLLTDGDVVDLGKAWHGLHFLLCGSAFGGCAPLFDAVLGGTPLGDPTSYEPVRLVTAEQVAAVAASLPAAADLVPRFTHRALRQAEIYPDEAWSHEDALTAFLLPAYDVLVGVFGKAAAAGNAVLITLDRG